MTDIAELSIQIEASAEKASKEIDKLIRRLDKLHTKLAGIDVSSLTGQLQALANVDLSNLDKLTGVKIPGVSGGSGGRGGGGGSTIHLSGGIKRLGSVMNASRRAIVNTSKGIAGLAKNMTTARVSVGQLANTFMNLYFKLFMIRRLFSGLGKAFTSSMDMIETYHYFDVAIGKIGEGAKKDFAQYGYDSAEAYADSFRKRSLELTEKMSGYTFDSEGNYRSNGMKNLGVDADMVMQYQAQYGQIADSIGMSGEAALATSKALTMLATDWSSLRNIDFETAFEKMASGLAGQSRAVRALGIDITQASLQQTAYNLGITTSISKMDQAAKAELRMITILDQSRVAWGDLANTLNTPANQLRLIRQNTISLARAIGNVFLPIVQKVLPYVNALIIAIRKLFEWVGGLLGVKVSDASSGMGGIGETFTDFGDDGAESLGNLGNASDDANKKLKELKKTVLAFDELNILNGNDDDSSSKSKSGTGSGGTGLGAGEQGILDASLLDMLDEYEKVWNEAFEKMEDKANAIADKITGVFGKIHDFIKAKDWAGLGKYIASGINQGLDWIYDKMVSISPRLTSFVDKVARTLNSLVDNVNWSRIGEIVGVGLNSITGAISRWYKTFNFYNLGQKLADGFNSLQDKVNWKNIGESIGGKLKAAIDLGLGFVNKVRFSSLGTNIATAINSAMNLLNLDHASDLFAKTFRGIFEIIDNFNDHFKWTELKFKITSFLNRTFQNLDLEYAGSVLNKALDKILDFAKYVSENVDFEKLGIEISKGLRRIQWRKHFETAFTVIKTILGSVMKGVLEEVFGDFGAGFATGFIDGVSGVVKTATEVISKLGEALNTLANAIERFSPGFGSEIGKIVGSFVGLTLLAGTGTKVINFIKTLFGLGGAAAAGGGAGGGGIGGMFKNILGGGGNGGFMNHAGLAGIGAIEFSKPLFEDFLDTFSLGNADSYIKAISVSIEDLGKKAFRAGEDMSGLETELMDIINSGKSEDEVIRLLALKLSEYGISADEFASSLTHSNENVSKSVLGASMQIAQKLKEVEGTFSYTKQSIANDAEQTKTNIANSVAESIRIISEYVPQVESIIRGSASEIYGAVSITNREIGSSTEEATKKSAGLYANMRSSVIATVGNMKDNTITTMTGMGGTVGTVITGMKQNIATIFGGMASDTKQKADSVRDHVSGGWATMKQNLISRTSEARTALSTAFAGMSSETKTNTDNTTSHISDKWYKLKASLEASVKGATTALTIGINGINNKAKLTFDPAIESGKKLETELGVNLVNTARNAASAIPNSFSGISNNIAGHFGGTYKAIYNAMGVASMYGLGASIIAGINQGISSTRIRSPYLANILWKRVDYGPPERRGWFEVPQSFIWNYYAKGGFPNMGELFFANESGPEMIGRMGHRNVVANNMQITEGIRDAVVDGMMDVMMAMSAQSNNGRQAPVIENTFKVDSETLFKAVQKGAKKMQGRGYKVETVF